MSADIFRTTNPDGTSGNWQYFSETKGDIVDAGTDEALAREMAEKDSPSTTIADCLASDSGPATANVVAIDGMPILPDLQAAERVSEPTIPLPKMEPPKQQTALVSAKPTRPPLSPAFVKKIVEQLGRQTTNLSIELERYLFRVFGFVTEELAEDDDDVQIIKLGWDAIWQEQLAGHDPPLWMILAFGYSCVTARLVVMAKREKKKEQLG